MCRKPSNYEAWSIDPRGFYDQPTKTDKLKFLVCFGILAPSSHNTQPWKFHVDNNSIEIIADFSRRPQFGDPTGRMTYIALGCAAENMIIAAKHYGFECAVHYNEQLSNANAEHAVTLTCDDKGLVSHDDALFSAITQRVSYRAEYQNKEVPAEIIDDLQNLVSESGINLTITNNFTDKKLLASIAGEGMKEKMSQLDFRKELATWIRNNWTMSRDGMPGSGHEMSMLKSLAAPWALRLIDVSPVEEKKAIKRVLNFGAVGIISTKDDNAAAWLHTGELLESVLLTLQSKGMAASIMVAAIESGESRKKLSTFIFEKTNQTLSPQMFFGLGYPTKVAPHSPRRGVEEVLT
ncbi:MAG: hypothetical protein HYV65_00285 [Candidatus Spechtbacteria bacterium]|nr:hypothetical protein [Candidatus Spechtbacteria bacterium]